MKKIMIVLKIFLLAGCTHQKTDATDIMKAELFCKDVGGIKYITVRFDGVEEVTCLSGVETSLSKVELTF